MSYQHSASTSAPAHGATHQDPISPRVSSPSAAASLWGSSIADPGPLGLAAFATTTFFLSVINTNMLGTSVQSGVLALALFYGGIAQLLAGAWEFTKGNTFGAVAFCSYGAFWMSFWYLLNHVIPAQVAAAEKGGPGAPTMPDILHGVGLFLLAWTIMTAYMTISSSQVSGALFTVFLVLELAFIALTIGFLTESPAAFAANNDGWIRLGGWLGIATAFAAWYVSFAGVVSATFKRAVLPTFPR